MGRFIPTSRSTASNTTSPSSMCPLISSCIAALRRRSSASWKWGRPPPPQGTAGPPRSRGRRWRGRRQARSATETGRRARREEIEADLVQFRGAVECQGTGSTGRRVRVISHRRFRRFPPIGNGTPGLPGRLVPTLQYVARRRWWCSRAVGSRCATTVSRMRSW